VNNAGLFMPVTHDRLADRCSGNEASVQLSER
jgi:hypothetical protein